MTPLEIAHSLRKFSTEELKEEIKRRREVDRARTHLASAEARFLQAKAKVESYRQLIKDYPERKGDK